MKKLLLTLSVAAFATQLFGARVDLSGSSLESRKYLGDYSSTVGDSYVLVMDSRTGEEVSSGAWLDAYLTMNPPKDSEGVAKIGNFVYSTGGKGIHVRYHMIFNDKLGAGEITSADRYIFNFNAFEQKDEAGESHFISTSSSYYLETATNSVFGTVNSTAERLAVDLYTVDGNYSNWKNPYGQYGRVFSIGKNITVNAKNLTVGGRYNGDKSTLLKDQDSKFIVNGDVNISGTSIQAKDSEASLHLTNTDAFVESTGKMTTAGGMSVTAGANLYINGGSVVAAKNSFVDNANLEMNGGTLTIGSSTSSANFSVVNNGRLTLKNGALLTINTISSDGESSVSQLGGTVLIDGSKLVLETSKSATFIANISGNMSLVNGSTISFKNPNGIGVSSTATLHVDKTSKIDGVCISFKDNNALSTVKLDGGDSFHGQLKVIRSRNNVIELAAGESYQFMNLQFKQQYNGQNCEIIFDLNGAAGLEIGSITGEAPDAYGDIIFKDFINGIVKITNIDASKLDESGIYTVADNYKFTFKGFDVNGDELKGGNWAIDSNNYLIYVPEPATYAAILGAIAIAFALKRRCSRK